MGKKLSTKRAERRAELRQRLLEAAEHRIAAEGLSALRARQLAAEVGCALGQIYNIYADLDGLILAANARTLDELDGWLVSAGTESADRPAEPAGLLVAQAETYLRFAGENRNRWRAVFEHRMSGGRELPAWYREQRAQLFRHVEQPLESVVPELSAERRARLGRSVFSAVHGMVALGLERRLGPQSDEELRSEVRTIVLAILEGLSSRRR